MPLRIQCINCQKVITVADNLKGKTIRCPFCQEQTRVPGGTGAPPQPGRAARTQMAPAPYEPAPPPPRRPVPRPAPQPLYEEPYVDEGAYEPPPPRRRRPEPMYDEPPPRPRRRGAPPPYGRRPARGSGGGGALKVILILFVVLGLVGGGVALYIFKPEWFPWGSPAYARFLPAKTNAVWSVNVGVANNSDFKKWTKLAAEVAIVDFVPGANVASLGKVLEAVDSIIVGGEINEDMVKKKIVTGTVILQTSSAVDVDIIKTAFHLGDKNIAGDRAYRIKEKQIVEKKTKPSKAKDKKDSSKDKSGSTKVEQFVYVEGKIIVLFRGTEEDLGNLLDRKNPLPAHMVERIKKLEKNNALWGYMSFEDPLKPKLKEYRDDFRKLRDKLPQWAAQDLLDKALQEKTLETVKVDDQAAIIKENIEKLAKRSEIWDNLAKPVADAMDLAQVLVEARSFKFTGQFDSGSLKIEMDLECDSDEHAKKGVDAVDHEKFLAVLADFLDTDTALGKSVADLKTSCTLAQEGSHITLKAQLPKAMMEGFDPLIMERLKELKDLQRKDKSIDLGNDVTLEIVRIEPGTFDMGDANAKEGKEARHTVQITKPFFMGTKEVTRGQFNELMGAKVFKELNNNKPLEETSAELPMEVSYNAAVEFCKKLSEKTGNKFDLPTEAEWEYACRAGTKTPFNTGEKLTKGQACFGKPPTDDKACPVGQFDANAFGLYDMHGNVEEWCKDAYDEAFYGSSNKRTDPQNPKTPTTALVVVRGGSWRTQADAPPTSFARRGQDPAISAGAIGFRVVMRP